MHFVNLTVNSFIFLLANVIAFILFDLIYITLLLFKIVKWFVFIFKISIRGVYVAFLTNRPILIAVTNDIFIIFLIQVCKLFNLIRLNTLYIHIWFIFRKKPFLSSILKLFFYTRRLFCKLKSISRPIKLHF
jgi:hypothetical protein